VLSVLAIGQIAAICAGLLFVVLRAPVFLPIDEHVHLDYVLHLLREDELPVLSSPAQPDIRAEIFGTRIEDLEPIQPGNRLSSFSYEAFQPPLYYLIAAPVVSLADDGDGNLLPEVRLLRLVSALCFLAAIALIAVLARLAVPRAPLAAFCAGLIPLMSPGTLLNLAQGTNQALELPLTVGLLCLLLTLFRGASGWYLLPTAATVAALLLTRTTSAALVPLVLAVVLRWAWRKRARPLTLVQLTGSAALGLALLAPWLIWNERMYGSLTGNAQAQALQLRIAFPIAFPPPPVTLGFLRQHSNEWLRTVLLPEQRMGVAVPAVVGVAVGAALFAILVVIAAAASKSVWRRYGEFAWRAVILVAPFLLTAFALVAVSFYEQFNIMRGRYLFASLPGVAIAFVAASRYLSSRALARWGLVAGITAGAFVMAALSSLLPSVACPGDSSPCQALRGGHGAPPFSPLLPGAVVEAAGTVLDVASSGPTVQTIITARGRTRAVDVRGDPAQPFVETGSFAAPASAAEILDGGLALTFADATASLVALAGGQRTQLDLPGDFSEAVRTADGTFWVIDGKARAVVNDRGMTLSGNASEPVALASVDDGVAVLDESGALGVYDVSGERRFYVALADEPTFLLSVGGGKLAIGDASTDALLVVALTPARDALSAVDRMPLGIRPDVAAGVPSLNQILVVDAAAGQVTVVDVGGKLPVAVQTFPTLIGAQGVAGASDGLVTVVGQDRSTLHIYQRPDTG
jgi:hypothetical protein